MILSNSDDYAEHLDHDVIVRIVTVHDLPVDMDDLTYDYNTVNNSDSITDFMDTTPNGEVWCTDCGVMIDAILESV